MAISPYFDSVTRHSPGATAKPYLDVAYLGLTAHNWMESIEIIDDLVSRRRAREEKFGVVAFAQGTQQEVSELGRRPRVILKGMREEQQRRLCLGWKIRCPQNPIEMVV